MPFPAKVSASTFLIHVGDVLCLRSELKMVRVDAFANVAAVEHYEPDRDDAVMNLPREPMSAQVPSADPVDAVAGRALVTLP